MESLSLARFSRKNKLTFFHALLFLSVTLLALNVLADPAPPPTITQITPNIGPTNGGTIVAITGMGFQSGATVYFGALPALSVTVNSDTSITAVTAPQFFGAVNVTITNADNQSATVTSGFTYAIVPTYNWTTIAGVALAGSVNGTNNAARFANPISMAEDASGNIFVANSGDNTIRKLTPSGTNWISSTIAGKPGVLGSTDGIGSAALFADPTGIAVDTNDNLFICDGLNGTIRKLTPSGTNWVSTTIAGTPGSFRSTTDGTNGTIRFAIPFSIIVDPTGNLYVTQGGPLRKLTPVGTNWVSSTIGSLSFGSTDGTNNTIKFGDPAGIALDAAGDLFVADTANHTIRKLTTDGTNWFSSTIAGLAGTAGSADGTNTDARFADPQAITVDANTNLYVADTLNNTVRLLTFDGTNWVTSTISGMAGAFGSADGSGGAAQFFRPKGILTDSTGHVFVADSFNNTIRQLALADTNWVTSTIAGQAGSFGSADGTNSAATFANPTTIAVDASNNVYVTDTASTVIRRLTPTGTNWITSTIAGSAFVFGHADGTNNAITFRMPQGIAADNSGNLYVSDTMNYIIRKLTHNGTNYVSSLIAGQVGLPGNTPSSFNLPVEVALDKSATLYVADQLNSSIVRIPTGFSGTEIAGGTSGVTGTNDGANTAIRLNEPTGVAVDARTNVYIADMDNNTIRRLSFTNTGWISTTIAGVPGIPGGADGTNNTALFSHPQSIAVDAQTNLYVADSRNFTIRKLTLTGTNWVTTTIGGMAGNYGSADGPNNNATFTSVMGVAVDTNGNVYVADSGNNTIRLATFAPAVRLTPNINWATPAPIDYGVLLNGNQLNAAANISGSFVYTPPAGTFLTLGTNTLSVVFQPTDTVDYQPTTNTVKLVVNPIPPQVAIGPTILGMFGSNVTFNPIVSGPGPFTYRWLSNGTNLANLAITTIAGKASLGFSGDGGAATNAALSHPADVALDASGNMFIADAGNSRIRKVDTNGIINTLAGLTSSGFSGDGGPSTNAGLNTPNCVFVDGIGNLFIADTGNHRVRKIDTNGIITTVAGNGTSTFSNGSLATNSGFPSVNAVTTDASGELFIADASGNSIRKVDTNGVVAIAAGKGVFGFTGDHAAATNAELASPNGVALDISGNLFIADNANNRIRKVDTNGIITTFAGKGPGSFSGDGGLATNANLNAPGGLAVDPPGNLFIADTSNSRVRKVNTNGIISTAAGNGTLNFSGDGGSPTNASLQNPGGVVVDVAGNLFIADTRNNCIRKVFFSPITTTNLSFTNLTAANSGLYQLVVTSPYGSTTNTVNLIVGLPPLKASLMSTGKLQLQLTGAASANYILQAATNLTPPIVWIPVATNTADLNGNASFTNLDTTANPNRYYRITTP